MDEETATTKDANGQSAGAPEAAFVWYHDAKRGFVIRQNVDEVPRGGWRNIEDLIQIFQNFNPALATVHVELR